MTKRFDLLDLDCANCALKMEDAIKKVDGVKDASVNFFTQRMSIDVEEEDFDSVMKKVVKVCRKVEPDCTILLK